MAVRGRKLRFILQLLLAFLVLAVCLGKKEENEQDKKPKKKKDIRDYNDADIERLFMEWEEAEEEHNPDDLLEHERPPAQIDLSQIDPGNPESALKLTKKGKTLMIFVSVSGNPTEEETETITNRWQSMLFNANYQFQRYPVSSNRVIFLLKDGSLAWEIKDFLIQQDECEEVSIEGQIFHGKGSGRKVDGKGKTIGLDDDTDGKSPKKTSKKSQPKEKSKGKSAKSDSKKDSEKDQSKTKDKSKETSSKSDSKEDETAGQDQTLKKDEQGKDDAVKMRLPKKPFRQIEEPEEVDIDDPKRNEPGYYTERAKQARERHRGYKSAVPLGMPTGEFNENEPPKEDQLKDEL